VAGSIHSGRRRTLVEPIGGDPAGGGHAGSARRPDWDRLYPLREDGGRPGSASRLRARRDARPQGKTDSAAPLQREDGEKGEGQKSPASD